MTAPWFEHSDSHNTFLAQSSLGEFSHNEAAQPLFNPRPDGRPEACKNDDSRPDFDAGRFLAAQNTAIPFMEENDDTDFRVPYDVFCNSTYGRLNQYSREAHDVAIAGLAATFLPTEPHRPDFSALIHPAPSVYTCLSEVDPINGISSTNSLLRRLLVPVLSEALPNISQARNQEGKQTTICDRDLSGTPWINNWPTDSQVDTTPFGPGETRETNSLSHLARHNPGHWGLHMPSPRVTGLSGR